MSFRKNIACPPAGGQCYGKFKHHLEAMGFTVYPTEFDCINSEHPLVDIAAKMGSFYWAFEYKSESDSISRGIEQLRCYGRWFDYVVLVSERFLDHRRSENYWKLKSMGAGLWAYYPDQDKCIPMLQPVALDPSSQRRRLVTRRFRARDGLLRRGNIDASLYSCLTV
ncbi:MAG: hypothetical protein M1368_07635 [Thaumarchaeota archaeon]|nr:hypothetical protein [Nitrososphaerota archaeon]